jgi:hypothetical protein
MIQIDESQFLIEYFKQVRGEITTRVQIHSNLILQKVATCGGALGFLLIQKVAPSESLVPTQIQLLGFAIIPIIAMGYDILIARNINSIHRLGTFIRNELEPLSPQMKSSLWETKYGLPDDSKPKNHGEHEIYFLSLFTFATEVTATVVYLNKQSSYLFIVLILLVLHIIVFIFMRDQILKIDIFDEGKR